MNGGDRMLKNTYKYSYEEVKNAFTNKGYELLSNEDEYTGVLKKLKYICNKHKDSGIQEISYSKLINNRGYKFCGRERTIKAKLNNLKISEDFVKNICEKVGFEYIDMKTDKNNYYKYVYFICKKHKEFGIQKMRTCNFTRDIKGCKYCKGDYPKEYVLNKIYETNPNIKIIGKYKNISTSVLSYCIKHDIKWMAKPQNLLLGCGCKKCGFEKLSKAKTLSLDEYKKIVYNVNPNLEIISDYKGMLYDVTVKCKKCGYIWSLNANSLKANGTSCKKCSYTYKGEDKIIEVLQLLNINYIHQYKFNDCIDKRPLPFDFYLPDYNVCIEFDGEQHYKPKFGLDNFKSTIFHDKIKNEYCKCNHVKLIRIPYWKASKIKEIIMNELCIV